MNLSKAKGLLLKNFPDATLHAQSAEDWTGPFPLPPKIATYYAEIGPAELEIWAYGNPWYLPSLAQLWDLQAGYRYHPETNERFDEWMDNWLVVAYDGGDPYIFDTDTEIIHRKQACKECLRRRNGYSLRLGGRNVDRVPRSDAVSLGCRFVGRGRGGKCKGQERQNRAVRSPREP